MKRVDLYLWNGVKLCIYGCNLDYRSVIYYNLSILVLVLMYIFV